jgi:hypothetical protein
MRKRPPSVPTTVWYRPSRSAGSQIGRGAVSALKPADMTGWTNPDGETVPPHVPFGARITGGWRNGFRPLSSSCATWRESDATCWSRRL